MGTSFRLILSSYLILSSIITFAQVDNPISADEARSLVKAKYKDGFDLGEKIFTIDKYEFDSDAINMQTSCPVKFTRPITGQEWHVKQNFADFLECMKPHLNRVYSVAYKYRYTDEEPFIDDNESIKLDGDIYSGKRKEAELAIAIDMVMEVYSMVFPFLDGFGGVYDENTDSDEYQIIDETLQVGNNVRRQWLIEELHKNPKRAGPLCDGLIQIFEDNFVSIKDEIDEVREALQYISDIPEAKWVTVSAGVVTVVGTAIIIKNPQLVVSAATATYRFATLSIITGRNAAAFISVVGPKFAKNIVEKVNSIRLSTKLKPLGRGSTGRTEPKNLNEKLAMEEVQENPLRGKETDLSLSDPRWPRWRKMQYMKELPDKTKINIHYNALYDKKGRMISVDDFKFLDE